jgi:hypothetical protein
MASGTGAGEPAAQHEYGCDVESIEVEAGPRGLVIAGIGAAVQQWLLGMPPDVGLSGWVKVRYELRPASDGKPTRVLLNSTTAQRGKARSVVLKKVHVE